MVSSTLVLLLVLKERFRIHKSDINTGKVRCGVANHLLNVCHSEGNRFEYLQIQLIEQVSVNNCKNIVIYLIQNVMIQLIEHGKGKILASSAIYINAWIK